MPLQIAQRTVGQIVYIGKQVKNNIWESLSILKGKSEEYLKQMLDNHREQTIKEEDNPV